MLDIRRSKIDKCAGLFFISFSVNLLALYFFRSTDFSTPDILSMLGLSLWFMSVFIAGLTVFLLEKSRVKTPEKTPSKRDFFLVIFLLFIAFIVRWFLISKPFIYPEESYWIHEALHIRQGLTITPFGFIGDQPSNFPAFYLLFFISFFSHLNLATRIATVVISLIHIFTLYLFARVLFGVKIALVASFLLAISLWDSHMANLGWFNVLFLPFLTTTTFYFLYKGLKTRSLIALFFAGFFLGLSFNLLYVSAINLIIAAIYIVTLFLRNTDHRLFLLRAALLIGFIVFLVSSPSFLKIARFPEKTLGRHVKLVEDNINYGEQFLTSVHHFFPRSNDFSVKGPWGITAEMPFFIFFFLGFTFCLFHFTRKESFLLMIGFFATFIPIVVVKQTTSVWREYGFLPYLIIFVAVGVNRATILAANGLRILTGISQVFWIKVLTIIILFSFAIYFSKSWESYFADQKKAQAEAYEATCADTANYIRQVVTKDTLVLLPHEVCSDLVELALYGDYESQKYNSYEDISTRLSVQKKIAVVQFSESYFSDQFRKDNPPELLESTLSSFFSFKILKIPKNERRTASVILYLAL